MESKAHETASHGIRFDGETPALFKPADFYGKYEKVCDKCVVTFSDDVVRHALERFDCERLACRMPIYTLDYKGEKIAFFMSIIGAAGAGTAIEDANCFTGATKFFMFGSCGSLDREISEGKLIVPTAAYRDEGLSYHYAPPSDYIEVKNANSVSAFFTQRGVPFVTGKTWTTDAIYRETAGKAKARRAEGCVAVEMECAGAQALCDFRGWEYYDFLFAGDVLHEDTWDARILGAGELDYQLKYFLLALELAASL